MTRRAFVRAAFTVIAGGFLDWLTRICRLDGDFRLAAAG